MSFQPDFSYPFVFFRKPDDSRIHFWEGKEGFLECSSDELLTLKGRYWVTAPFDFFYHAKLLVFKATESRIVSAEEWAQLTLPSDTFHELPLGELADTPRYKFENGVEEAVRQIKEGRFLKTALSKIRNIELTSGYDWTDWFLKSKNRFTNTFVFFLHIPEKYTWAGATPELFLSSDSEEIRSVSLAGTLHADSAHDWREKETREQALVSDFIQNTFLGAGFRDVTQSEPVILSLGNLKHIQTAFKAPVAGADSASLSKLLNMLHPTPAVGGLPQREGVEFLINTESHARNLYSGFLGPYEDASHFNLFVNLRSMQVCKNRAILYAGAGITDDSKPEEEWSETENKLRMNIDILQSYLF